MKKTLTTLIFYFFVLSVNAKDSCKLSFHNITQNFSVTGSTGDGTIVASANIGDSVSVAILEDMIPLNSIWYFNGVAIPNSSSGPCIVVIAQLGTFSSTCGCGLGFPGFFSGTITLCMTPVSVPAPPLFIYSSRQKVCPGNNVTYSTSAIAGCTENYRWTLPQQLGGTIVNTSSASLNIHYTTAFVASDTIRVAIVNSAGVSAELSKLIELDFPDIPPPLIGSTNNLCGQTNVEYHVQNSISGTTYHWIVPTGATLSSVWGVGNGFASITYPSVFLNDYVQVYSTNTCGTGPNRKYKVTTLPVSPAFSGGLRPCQGSQIEYSLQTLTAGNNYNWTSAPGSTISDGTNTSSANTLTTASGSVVVTYATVPANSSIKVQAANTCGTSVVSKKFLKDCLQNPGEKISANNLQSATLYPNPAIDFVKINFSLEKEKPCHIYISDVTGRIISGNLFTGNKDNNEYTIPVSDFEKGPYFVYLNDEVSNKVFKFIKE